MGRHRERLFGNWSQRNTGFQQNTALFSDSKHEDQTYMQLCWEAEQEARHALGMTSDEGPGTAMRAKILTSADNREGSSSRPHVSSFKENEASERNEFKLLPKSRLASGPNDAKPSLNPNAARQTKNIANESTVAIDLSYLASSLAGTAGLNVAGITGTAALIPRPDKDRNKSVKPTSHFDRGLGGKRQLDDVGETDEKVAIIPAQNSRPSEPGHHEHQHSDNMNSYSDVDSLFDDHDYEADRYAQMQKMERDNKFSFIPRGLRMPMKNYNFPGQTSNIQRHIKTTV